MPGLPPYPDPLARTSIKGPGDAPVKLLQCRVVRADKRNWTVDLESSVDRRVFLGVPVACPYVDFRGAGFWGHSGTKALAYVAVPSDNSAPFVIGFIPPPRGRAPQAESTGVVAESEAEQVALDQAAQEGKVDKQSPTFGATYDSGRPELDEEDWSWRGPEGNFVTVYASGLLAIGSTKLSQRIYIPLTQKILDVCMDYEMKHPGGGMLWGLQKRPGRPGQQTHLFRLLADSKHIDMRVRYGSVTALGEPAGQEGMSVSLAALDIKEEEAAIEVCFSPQGFDADTGEPLPGAQGASTFRVFLTKTGGLAARFEGSVLLRARRLRVEVEEDMVLSAKTIALQASGEGSMNIQGGSTLKLGGETVIVNGGSRSAVGDGDPVTFAVQEAPISGTLNGQAFVGVVKFSTPPVGRVTGTVNRVKVP